MPFQVQVRPIGVTRWRLATGRVFATNTGTGTVETDAALWKADKEQQGRPVEYTIVEVPA